MGQVVQVYFGRQTNAQCVATLAICGPTWFAGRDTHLSAWAYEIRAYLMFSIMFFYKRFVMRLRRFKAVRQRAKMILVIAI
jgi:hypothetical protein